MQKRQDRNLTRFFWLFAALMLVSCGSPTVRAPVEGREVSAPAKARLYHTVSRGDTLYSIAWRYGIDYKELAQWNRIRAPYRIYPGERLRLTVNAKVPKVPARRAVREPRAHKPAPSGASKTASKRTTSSTLKRPPSPRSSAQAKPPPAVKKTASSAAKRVTWTWPAEGRLVKSFSQTGKKGVDIAGKLGQPVYAAGHGRVVYSGSGLLGYGKLIIVKHDKNYLSAYAHNHRILVNEGDEVASGQRIAQMGRTGADRVKLHFEIRRDGKPVDPLRYLPKT